MANSNQPPTYQNIFNIPDSCSAMDLLATDVNFEFKVPRYLVMRSTEPGKFKNYPKHNLMVILRTFLDLAQADVDKLPEIGVWVDRESQETSFNIKTKSDQQSEKLLKAKEIFGVKVKVDPHDFKNGCKAKVWDHEGTFAAFSDVELKEALASQGVRKVKRGEFKKDKNVVPGKQYFLEFHNPEPPRYLVFRQLGIRMEVEKFVPRPTRCFKCQKFGHGKPSCRDKEVMDVCANCGVKHDLLQGIKCEKVPYCVNCKGAHSAASFDCPAYKQEAYIRKIAAEKDLPPRDVLRSMKQKGEYINYSKPTNAQRVFAAEANDRQERSRLDVVEQSMEDLKSAVLTLVELNKKALATRTSDDSMDMSDIDVRIAEGSRKMTDQLDRLKIEKLEAENKRLKAENQSMQELKDEVRDLRNEIKEKDGGASGVESESMREITSLKEQVKSLQETCESLQVSLKNKDSELEGVKDKKKGEKVKILEGQVKELRGSLSTKEAEIGFIKQEQEMWNKAKDDLERKHSLEIVDRDKKLGRLQEEIQRLKLDADRGRPVNKANNPVRDRSVQNQSRHPPQAQHQSQGWHQSH